MRDPLTYERLTYLAHYQNNGPTQQEVSSVLQELWTLREALNISDKEMFEAAKLEVDHTTTETSQRAYLRAAYYLGAHWAIDKIKSTATAKARQIVGEE